MVIFVPLQKYCEKKFGQSEKLTYFCTVFQKDMGTVNWNPTTQKR